MWSHKPKSNLDELSTFLLLCYCTDEIGTMQEILIWRLASPHTFRHLTEYLQFSSQSRMFLQMPQRSRWLLPMLTSTRARMWRCSATPHTTPPWTWPSPGPSTGFCSTWKAQPDRTTGWKGWVLWCTLECRCVERLLFSSVQAWKH